MKNREPKETDLDVQVLAVMLGHGDKSPAEMLEGLLTAWSFWLFGWKREAESKAKKAMEGVMEQILNRGSN